MGPQKSSKSWDITNHNYSIETHFLNIPISRNPMRRRAKWPSSCARRCRSGHRDAGTHSRRAPHAPPPWNMKRTERGVVEIIFTTTMEFCPTWIGTYASKLRFSELYKVYKVYKVYIYMYIYIVYIHLQWNCTRMWPSRHGAVWHRDMGHEQDSLRCPPGNHGKPQDKVPRKRIQPHVCRFNEGLTM